MIPADWSLRMDDRRTDNLPRFKDQVALVVGAAHGIGKAIAVRLGREGAEVVIADVDRRPWRPPFKKCIVKAVNAKA